MVGAGVLPVALSSSSAVLHVHSHHHRRQYSEHCESLSQTISKYIITASYIVCANKCRLVSIRQSLVQSLQSEEVVEVRTL